MALKDSVAEMPFLDHLEELRQRLFRVAVALAVGFGIALTLILRAHFDPVAFLKQPLDPYLISHGGQLTFDSPGATFSILMTTSFILAALFASPVIGYQLWLFFAPALHKNERKIAIPAIAAVTSLFVGGVVFAYYIIIPATLRFFFAIESDAITPMITWDKYFSFVSFLCLGFGALCELPMLIILLTALGWLTPNLLTKYRRHMVVASLAAGGWISPDVISMFEIGGVMYALYELSIVASRIIYKRRQQRIARRERDESRRDHDEPTFQGPKRLVEA
jgi:sec-independent protein translocase protein TatC